MMMNNSIYLQKRNKVGVDLKEKKLDMQIEGNKEIQSAHDAGIATIINNFSYYGFAFSAAVIDKLRNSDYNEVISWYFEINKILKDVLGVRPSMEPLYKNFPESVMNTVDGEMYLASYLHLVNNTFSPDVKMERIPLDEFKKLTVLELGTQEDFNTIFTNLISGKVSLGEPDKKVIDWFVDKYEDITSIYPESIPNKENLVYISKLVINKYGYDSENTQHLTSVYKTATDVLRLAVALSDGDISLSEKTKFRSFKKIERRFLLQLLDNCKNLIEDMNKYRMQWIILGEILHPGDYATRYPNAYKSFFAIRNGETYKGFFSKVESAFDKKNLNTLLKLLSSRPGEFARRIDRLLVTFSDTQSSKMILDTFKSVATNVETTVILGLMQHMTERKTTSDIRIFFPKGNMSKAYTIDNNLKPIDDTVIDETIKVCKDTLTTIYQGRESMGNVFIDESLKNYAFPMVLRSSSRTLKPMARGSKMKLEDTTNIARVFMYWKESDISGCVDLDLSVVLLDSDFNNLDIIYYGNLNSSSLNNKYQCYHSGDIRTAPNGASEYIDLNLSALEKAGVKYVAVCANSFSGTPYSELDEAFVGFMERSNPKSGEIYEPSTVTNKSDLISPQKATISMILNVSEREFIWTDIGFDGDVEYIGCNNIPGRAKSITQVAKAMIKKPQLSMYDVLMLNANTRGSIVTNKADADYIFSLDGYVEPEIEQEVEQSIKHETVNPLVEEVEVITPKRILITPYDIDVLISNYL